MVRIGLISDTHGLLRDSALAFLAGCNHIVHGGDIGSEAILDRLAAIAPVSAVRGNNDHGAWAERLPRQCLVEFERVRVCVVHALAELEFDAHAAGVQVVVSGHSHKPRIVERDGVLYVNPGSAGPRRFRLPICVGELMVDGTHATPRVAEIASG